MVEGVILGQVSAQLRRSENGYSHWCPGCTQMHVISDAWTFNGDLVRPTLMPSVAIEGVQRRDTGYFEWEYLCDEAGQPIPYRCHYFLTFGQLQYCADCTHPLSGQSVPLPELPPFMRDHP